MKKFNRAAIVLKGNLQILKELKFPDGGFTFEGLCVLELQRRKFRAALDYAEQFEEVARKKKHHENVAKAQMRHHEAEEGIKAERRASLYVNVCFLRVLVLVILRRNFCAVMDNAALATTQLQCRAVEGRISFWSSARITLKPSFWKIVSIFCSCWMLPEEQLL